MKVLFSLSYYFPYISGLSDYVKRLAESMCGTDILPEIICTKHLSYLADREIINGVSVNRLNKIGKMGKWIVPLLNPLRIFRIFQNTDKVVINLPQPEAIIYSILAKLLGKKIIAIYHCDYVFGSDNLSSILNFCLRSVNSICLNLADSVVVNSFDYAYNSSLLKNYLKKVQEIFPVIGLESGKKINKRSCSPKMRIGYLGRISREKGIHILLRAISSSGNAGKFSLIMAGPRDTIGEESYLREISQLITDTNIDVKNMGFLPDQAKRDFFNNIDVLVIPATNSSESFGIVQVEAMQHGIPVLASDLPGVRQVIAETAAGLLVKAGDHCDWAEKLEMALSSIQKYRKNTHKVFKKFNGLIEFKKWKTLLNS